MNTILGGLSFTPKRSLLHQLMGFQQNTSDIKRCSARKNHNDYPTTQFGITQSSYFQEPWHHYCKDCLVFMLRSEQKLPCQSAHRPRVRCLFPFVISSRFSPLLSPSLSTRPPAQDNCERITFHPTLTASRFPPFISFLFLFPCTLGNDNRFSAAAARHSYAPEHSSIDFSSFSLTFSFIFFLQFS